MHYINLMIKIIMIFIKMKHIIASFNNIDLLAQRRITKYYSLIDIIYIK